MANRKALSSSRQAMNAVQPISTYEGFGTVLFVTGNKIPKATYSVCTNTKHRGI